MADVSKPMAEGLSTITPHLVVRGAEEAIAFYRDAFGAEVVSKMASPGGGTLLHAELRIGGSKLYLCDEFPDMGARGPEALGGSPVVIHLGVPDIDATFDRAVGAGATAQMPPADMFWGDRFAKLVDPFGHCWSISTPIEQVGPNGARRRLAKDGRDAQSAVA